MAVEAVLFPPLDPRVQAHLPVGGGHAIAYEECGSPGGMPVLFLHGGPGSACGPQHRRFFDPARWRIVLADQRGCGRSLPAGELRGNDTAALVDDIEALRRHLGVERWVLFGGSWGSTLALAYARSHPQHVRALVLRGLFLAGAEELRWYLEGLGTFLPMALARLGEGAPAPAAALVEHYAHQVLGPDPAAALAAAGRWADYEAAAMALGEGEAPPAPVVPDAALLRRMAVQLHYLRHACFLEPGALLDAAPRLAHLPAVLVQGSRDFVCPPLSAWRLAARWPGLRLRWVPGGGHAALGEAMARALVEETAALRERLEGER